MSENEVEAANGAELQESESGLRFYVPKPNVQDPSRYKVRKQSSASLLGREATVYYVFFDDKLFSYHVFIRDGDAAKLYRDTADYLSREFGPDYSPQSDGTPLQRLWHKQSLIVNFWFLRLEYSLRDAYQAAFGVVYTPLEQAISD